MTMSKEQRKRIVTVLCLQAGEPIPWEARAKRRRQVEVLRLQAGLPAAIPTPEERRAQRIRQVQVLKLACGEPLSPPAPVRRRAEPIDVAPIKAAWDAIQRDRHRRYEVLGLSLENHGSRARCRRCGEIVMDVPHGLVGVTPSALYVMHAQATGCR